MAIPSYSPVPVGSGTGFQSCTGSYVEIIPAPAAGYSLFITDIVATSNTAADGGILYVDNGTDEIFRCHLKTCDARHFAFSSPLRVGDGLAVRIKGDSTSTHATIIAYTDHTTLS